MARVPATDHVQAFVAHVGRSHPATRLGQPRPPTAAELLTLAWLLTAARAWRPDPAAQAGLVRTLRQLDKQMDAYEDRLLLDVALELIPLQDLYAALPDDLPDDESIEEHLAAGLAAWFKRDFMRWVDPIECDACGGPTESIAGGMPTAEEQAGGAVRVELWKCTACAHVNRFPRLNELRALMRSRRGRCGEFANVFCLFLRAIGLRARYVWCDSDHVWNEFWNPATQRWTHVDPSEGKTAQPLLYALGWRKSFSYVLAFSTTGARDVTLAYAPSPTLPKGRDRMGERDLRQSLGWLTDRRRAALGARERQTLRAENAEERRWERDWRGRVREEEARAAREGTEGRVSGGAAWRQSRGEGLGGGQAGFEHVNVNSPPFFDLASSAKAQLFGSATRTPGALTLTPCVPSATGAAFLPLPLPSPSTSFVATLTFRITPPPPPATCADGMAIGVFVLPEGQAPSLGEGGAGMGYQGLTRTGWIVEVDTYQTEDRTRDPPTPHISLHSPPDPHHRHSLSHAPPSALPALTDGRPYTLRIHSVPGRVDVRLREGDGAGVEALNDAGAWTGVCASDRVPVLADRNSQAWLGVNASCGGFFEQHDVLAWQVWLIDPQPAAVDGPGDGA